MAFFSADEFDRSVIGNPWNAAAIVMILLTALALLLWMAGAPASSPYSPYHSPSFGYDASP